MLKQFMTLMFIFSQSCLAIDCLETKFFDLCIGNQVIDISSIPGSPNIDPDHTWGAGGCETEVIANYTRGEIMNISPLGTHVGIKYFIRFGSYPNFFCRSFVKEVSLENIAKIQLIQFDDKTIGPGEFYRGLQILDTAMSVDGEAILVLKK